MAQLKTHQEVIDSINEFTASEEVMSEVNEAIERYKAEDDSEMVDRLLGTVKPMTLQEIQSLYYREPTSNNHEEYNSIFEYRIGRHFVVGKESKDNYTVVVTQIEEHGAIAIFKNTKLVALGSIIRDKIAHFAVEDLTVPVLVHQPYTDATGTVVYEIQEPIACKFEIRRCG